MEFLLLEVEIITIELWRGLWRDRSLKIDDESWESENWVGWVRAKKQGYFCLSLSVGIFTPLLFISVFTSNSGLLYTPAKKTPSLFLLTVSPSNLFLSHIQTLWGPSQASRNAQPKPPSDKILMCCRWLYYNPHNSEDKTNYYRYEIEYELPFPIDDDLSKYTTFKPHQ